jgi:hypothetical protein
MSRANSPMFRYPDDGKLVPKHVGFGTLISQRVWVGTDIVFCYMFYCILIGAFVDRVAQSV